MSRVLEQQPTLVSRRTDGGKGEEIGYPRCLGLVLVVRDKQDRVEVVALQSGCRVEESDSDETCDDCTLLEQRERDNGIARPLALPEKEYRESEEAASQEREGMCVCS